MSYQDSIQERLSKLQIEKTPDTSRRFKDAKKKGKNTGMGVWQLYETLFAGNEMLSKNKKMTDEEIKRQILLEFPEQEKPLGRPGRSGKKTINELRQRFLRGDFTKGERPSCFSYRYDIDGDRVDGRYGTKKLTLTEQHEMLEQFETFWMKEGTDGLNDNGTR